MRARAAVSRVAVAVTVTIALVSCTLPSSPEAVAPRSAVIGASGGSLASADGVVEIEVPPGALGSAVTLTVEPVAAPVPGAVGTVYAFGPDGTRFLAPVTIRFHYGAFDLAGHAPSNLRPAAYVPSGGKGGWLAWPGSVVDTVAKTVSAQIRHFSNQALVDPSSPGGACYVEPAGACSRADGGPSCPVETCASAPRCTTLPGSTLASCTDTQDGPEALCCYEGGTTSCTTVRPPACSAADGGPPCPKPPTCASTPSPCPTGATLSSCTDDAAGYAAVCCSSGAAPVDAGTEGGGEEAGATTSSDGGFAGCGQKGMPCCAGGTCYSAALHCEPGNTCQQCGTYEDDCCAGSLCFVDPNLKQQMICRQSIYFPGGAYKCLPPGP